MSNSPAIPLPSSFRDPSGFVYLRDGTLYRQVNQSYQKEYDHLMANLYQVLVKKGLLIPHEEVPNPAGVKEAYKTLQPEPIPFISYPYEWCFSQLKAAALATLRIQQMALKHGLSLKDASAFNIQFLQGKPVLIDTLSFESYPANRPWVAYRQFCQHFLAPLALMAKVDLRLGTLSERYLDGIPLDLASSLLPKRTRLSLGLGAHLHLHARSQNKHSDSPSTSTSYTLSQERLVALLQNLTDTVNSLQFPRQKTTWGNYYTETNYTSTAQQTKQRIVQKWIDQLKPGSVWDAGANDGTFSRLASQRHVLTLASDIDPVAVEQSYLTAQQQKDSYVLPLVIDLTNPSHAIGWAEEERSSFLSRCQPDLTLCLALIHHLAIANNVPLGRIASLFSKHTQHLVIEFVPKEDSNTQRLLAAREDIFPYYNQKDFETEFSRFFSLEEQEAVPESSRILYLMKRRRAP